MSAWSGLTEADYTSALAQARGEYAEQKAEWEIEHEGQQEDEEFCTLEVYLADMVEMCKEDCRRADDAYSLLFYMAAQARLFEEVNEQARDAAERAANAASIHQANRGG